MAEAESAPPPEPAENAEPAAEVAVKPDEGAADGPAIPAASATSAFGVPKAGPDTGKS